MTIHEKLLKIQTELKAPKNRWNKFGEFHYRSLEDILDALKPLLNEVKATVILQDSITEHNDRIYVMAMANFVDIENPETPQICVTAFAREPLDKKKMDVAQITGTASSYARKYALNGLFLIDDIKDSDTDEYKREIDASVMDEIIDAKQLENINKLLNEANVTEEKFCEIYGIQMLVDLPADKYKQAVSKLEAAIKHKKGEKNV